MNQSKRTQRRRPHSRPRSSDARRKSSRPRNVRLPASESFSTSNPRTRRSFRTLHTAIIAGVAGLLALVGMFLRYPAGSQTPLPGMDHLQGQFIWSVILSATMLLLAWVVRGIFMKGLQYAVLISLVVHLVLLLTAHLMHLETTVARIAEAMEIPGGDLDDAIPDYGAFESEPNQTQAWQQPVETNTPESQMQRMQRQETNVEVRDELEPVENNTPREITEPQKLQRRELEARLQEMQRQEMARRELEKQQLQPERIEQPKVQTRNVQETKLIDNAEVARTKTKNERPQRDRQSPEEMTPKEVAAAKVKVKTSQPSVMSDDPRPSLTQKSANAAQAAAADAESQQVAAARAAAAAQAEASAVEVIRRRDMAQSSKRETAAESSLPRTRVSQSAAAAGRPADANPQVSDSAAIAAAQSRERTNAQSTAQAASSNAQTTEVAAAQAVGQANLRVANTSVGRSANSGLSGGSVAQGNFADTSAAGSQAWRPTSQAPGRSGRATGARPTLANQGSGSPGQLRSRVGNGASAAATSTQSVDVASVGLGAAPSISESQASRIVGRGTSASIPSRRAGTGQSPGVASRQVGSTAFPSNRSGQGAGGGTGQARLGSAPSSSIAQGTGRSRGQASAVGSGAEQVAISTRSGNGGSAATAGILGSGPRSSRVGRQSTALPATGAGTGRGGVGTSLSKPVSGSGVRSLNTGAITARTTGPSARLGQATRLSGGTGAGLPARQTRLAGLSDNEIQAEQTGSLVMSGPTAKGGGPLAGGLSGPTRISVGRRRASLPGRLPSSRLPSQTGRNGSPTRPSNLGSRAAKGRERSPRLSMETKNQLASLIKRSSNIGRAAGAKAELPPGFSLRKQELRKKAARELGGNAASEEAVELGLKWLAQHQNADGRWSIHSFHENCKDHKCSGHGSFQSDTAGTGLALLAFLGAGYTHQTGPHQRTVQRALDWLTSNQKPNGDLYHGEAKFVWLYSHGMASIAVCEAYGLTKDPKLREPAQKAIDFIVEAQHPEFGGWRYRPRFESDTSVTGWMLMALKSADISGLKVPSRTYQGVTRWVNSVEKQKGRFAYHPSRPASLAMTAESMLMKQYLGAERNDASLVAGAEYLRANLPRAGRRDVYYWYYATQAMFHMQGAYWDEWNGRLRDSLTSTQMKDGGSAGSWNPMGSAKDKWGEDGGRLYVTCLNLLMLEVYYRHLPLYLELEK